MPTTRDALAANIETTRQLLTTLNDLAGPLDQAATLLRDALLSGHKLLACGNGGSAADSAHFTTEIAGRFLLERRGYPAIDLTANHAFVTAIINDYPSEQVFARQVRAFGTPGDVLAAFTTSGNSANVRLALEAAKETGIKTIAFLGRDGGKCKGLADVELIVKSPTTARIQEAHLVLYHTLCQVIDAALAK